MIREGVAKALKKLLDIEEMPFNVPPQRGAGGFLQAPSVCPWQNREGNLQCKIAQEMAEGIEIEASTLY